MQYEIFQIESLKSCLQSSVSTFHYKSNIILLGLGNPRWIYKAIKATPLAPHHVPNFRSLNALYPKNTKPFRKKVNLPMAHIFIRPSADPDLKRPVITRQNNSWKAEKCVFGWILHLKLVEIRFVLKFLSFIIVIKQRSLLLVWIEVIIWE